MRTWFLETLATIVIGIILANIVPSHQPEIVLLCAVVLTLEGARVLLKRPGVASWLLAVKGSRQAMIITTPLVMALGAVLALTYWLVILKIFVPSLPLTATITPMLTGYPAGSTVAGIAWQPHLADSRIRFTNENSEDIEAIDILIRPSDPIEIIGQFTAIPGVSFLDATPAPPNVPLRGIVLHGPGGDTVLPLNSPLVDIFAGRRLRCEKLPRKSYMEVVIGTGNQNDMQEQIRTRFRWGQNRFPASITLSGEYRLGGKTLRIDEVKTLNN